MNGNDQPERLAGSSILNPGHQVGAGRFTLIRQLGRGGMGVVWLARDDRLNEEVALKFLPPEVSADAMALGDLRRETQKSRRLTHPNIIRIHDLYEAPGEAPFISMEYVEGSNLQILRVDQPQSCFAWERVAPLAAELCAALDYAHGQKVIHRDLKPANLMLDGKGHLKLADFGIAATISDSVSRISARYATSGTLAYMSPQQMNGEQPRPSDDIYAFGATLYEFLTSRPPFYLGNIPHQVLNVPPPPLAQRLAELEVKNEVPEAVSAMIMACLSKEPAKRPQNMRAIAEWLSLEMGGNPSSNSLAASFHRPEPAPVEAEQIVEPAPASTGRKTKALISASLLGLAILCAGGWYISKHSVQDKNSPPIEANRIETKAQDSPVEKIVTKSEGPGYSEMFTNTLGMRFVPVPGTKVLFSIWDTRVQDFEAFVNATGYDATAGMNSSKSDGWKQRGDTWKSPGFAQGPTHPVCGVSWDDAKAFCAWLTKKEQAAGKISLDQSYRLPTDAEWDVAVGTDLYPWGNQWPPPAGAGNYAGSEAADANWSSGHPTIAGYNDGYVRTSPVGSFNANRYGLYDMSGNLWQWCEDWYRKELNSDEVRKKFTGLDDDGGGQQYRVLRGASWLETAPVYLRSGFRFRRDPGRRFDDRGFRCVLVAASSAHDRESGDLPGANESASNTVATTRQNPGLSQFYTNSLGMRFVPVSGTKVLFSIWDTRVQDFEAFVKATGYDATEDMQTLKSDGWKKRGDTWKSPGFAQGPTHPVCGVNWGDAQSFCAWLTKKEQAAGKINSEQSYRLPTDAEWNVAVGDDLYPWGNQWPPPPGAGNYAGSEAANENWPSDQANQTIAGYKDGYARTSPVGSFNANRYGLYDMGGNLWQWSEDWYRKEMNSDDIRKEFPNLDNDGGGQQFRVFRGGSWNNGGSVTLRSAYRTRGRPEVRYSFNGFRCVLDFADAAETETIPDAPASPTVETNPHESWTFTTFAGKSGNPNARDGVGKNARFDRPQGIAVDTEGNIYVAEASNTIRLINPSGDVSTLAGLAGTPGSNDGVGAEARFRNPSGISVDRAGNVYVADTDNHTIRKIAQSGTVTTIAGEAGSIGSTDGLAARARFNHPKGIVVASDGIVFVADWGNNTIRKITPEGKVSTVAGLAGNQGTTDGWGAAARFNGPTDLAVGPGGGFVYVTDTGNHTIRQIGPRGFVKTLYGQPGVAGSADGVQNSAQFNKPNGIARDGGGNFYVADWGNKTIRKITRGGTVTTIGGLAGNRGSSDGAGPDARFMQPVAVALDTSGDIYIADVANNTIRKGHRQPIQP